MAGIRITRKSSAGHATQYGAGFAGKAGTSANPKPRFTRKSSAGHGTQLSLGFGGRSPIIDPPSPTPTPSPITVIPLVSMGDGTDASLYTTGAFTSPVNELIVACYSSERTGSQPTTPTVIGHDAGEPWALIATIYYSTSAGTRRSLFLFACISGHIPQSGPITFDHLGTHAGACASIFAVTNADEAHGLVQTFVQAVFGPVNSSSGTAVAFDLSLPADPRNRSFALFAIPNVEDITQRVNWTEIHEVNHPNPNSTLASAWRQDDFETSLSASWASSTGPFSGIGWEIKVGAPDVDELVTGGAGPPLRKKRKKPDLQQANLVIVVDSQYRII